MGWEPETACFRGGLVFKAHRTSTTTNPISLAAGSSSLSEIDPDPSRSYHENTCPSESKFRILETHV